MEIIFYRGKPDDRTILGVRENEDGSVVCWNGYRGGDGRTSFDGELVKMSCANASVVRAHMRVLQGRINLCEIDREIDFTPMCVFAIQKIVAHVIDFSCDYFMQQKFSAEIRGEPLPDF